MVCFYCIEQGNEIEDIQRNIVDIQHQIDRVTVLLCNLCQSIDSNLLSQELKDWQTKYQEEQRGLAEATKRFEEEKRRRAEAAVIMAQKRKEKAKEREKKKRELQLAKEQQEYQRLKEKFEKKGG